MTSKIQIRDIPTTEKKNIEKRFFLFCLFSSTFLSIHIDNKLFWTCFAISLV